MFLFCKIVGTILERDACRTSTNGTENKRVDDDVLGFIPERWPRQTIGVKKRKGRRTTIIEDSGNASIWGLDDYIKKSKDRLITVAGNSSDNIRANRRRRTGKQRWKEKQLDGYFKRQAGGISWRSGYDYGR